MHKQLKLLTGGLLFFFIPFTALAATHEVSVNINSFSPNELSIEVGDTVRWTNNSGLTHDVTADDFSWGSATSSSFVYERTFDSVEEVLYHCTVHSSPGRDINTSMNGRISVTEAAEPIFQINDAMSDNWFYPPTNGQGFFIVVWEDIKTIFLAWFTYEVERPPEDAMAVVGEPGHRWLMAQGPYEDDTAMLDVFLASGMVFDKEEPPVNDPQKVGTMEIIWTGCDAGVVFYDLPLQGGLMGEIPIQRITQSKVPECEAAQQ